MSKAAVETFKFALYLSIPVVATVVYSDPDTMGKIQDHFRYIEVRKHEGRGPPAAERQGEGPGGRVVGGDDANKGERMFLQLFVRDL